MKTIQKLFLIISLITTSTSIAQITGNGASTTQGTAYTDGSPQDVIYIYCVPPGTPATLGSLTTTPAGGPGPGTYTFDWFQYNTGTNSFDPYTSVNNPTSSTINNLPSGGYSVSILNASGSVIGCYKA